MMGAEPIMASALNSINLFISNDNPRLPTLSYIRLHALARDWAHNRGCFASSCRKPILKRGWLRSVPCAGGRQFIVASSIFLDGSMIPRQAERTLDERDELRHAAVSSTAVLEFRGASMSSASSTSRRR